MCRCADVPAPAADFGGYRRLKHKRDCAAPRRVLLAQTRAALALRCGKLVQARAHSYTFRGSLPAKDGRSRRRRSPSYTSCGQPPALHSELETSRKPQCQVHLQPVLALGAAVEL